MHYNYPVPVLQLISSEKQRRIITASLKNMKEENKLSCYKNQNFQITTPPPKTTYFEG